MCLKSLYHTLLQEQWPDTMIFHYSYGLGTISRINWKSLNKIYFPVFSPSIVHLLWRLILTYMCVCMPVINWQGLQQFTLTVTGHIITRKTKPDLHRYTEEGHSLQDHGWNQVCHAAWTSRRVWKRFFKDCQRFRPGRLERWWWSSLNHASVTNTIDLSFLIFPPAFTRLPFPPIVLLDLVNL